MLGVVNISLHEEYTWHWVPEGWKMLGHFHLYRLLFVAVFKMAQCQAQHASYQTYIIIWIMNVFFENPSYLVIETELRYQHMAQNFIPCQFFPIVCNAIPMVFAYKVIHARFPELFMISSQIKVCMVCSHCLTHFIIVKLPKYILTF
jgi:hypothetical protein